MGSPDLIAFAGAIAAGDIEVVDLTHTLAPEFPTIVMPPELGQCAPFRIEEVSRYDERGPAWYHSVSSGPKKTFRTLTPPGRSSARSDSAAERHAASVAEKAP